MKFILLLLLATSVNWNGWGQRINPPHWSQEGIEVVTAKIEVQNSLKKKVFEGYKQSSFSIYNDQKGQVDYVTIDIPDWFYMKQGRVHSYHFNGDEDSETITYTVFEGDKMASITLIYSSSFTNTSETPISVFVQFTDNIKKTPVRFTIVFFREIK